MKILSEHELYQVNGGWVAAFGGAIIELFMKAAIPPVVGFAVGGLYAGTQYLYNQTKDQVFAASAIQFLDPILNSFPGDKTWLATTIAGAVTAVGLVYL